MFLHGNAVSLVKGERKKADAPQTVLMSVSRFSQCAIHIRGVRHKLKLGVCKPRISALKWGAGGWAGGLYRKLKEIRVGSKHLKLKMFSKRTRELIKTHSVSKKSRTGNSPAPLNSPSVSRTASLDFSSCQSTWLTFHSRAHVIACFSTLLKNLRMLSVFSNTNVEFKLII